MKDAVFRFLFDSGVTHADVLFIGYIRARILSDYELKDQWAHMFIEHREGGIVITSNNITRRNRAV